MSYPAMTSGVPVERIAKATADHLPALSLPRHPKFAGIYRAAATNLLSLIVLALLSYVCNPLTAMLPRVLTSVLATVALWGVFRASLMVFQIVRGIHSTYDPTH